jgi:serine protease AprX
MCRSARVIMLIAATLICSNLFAVQYAYIVSFTDKNNTPFSLSAPNSYLSSRAIARRAAQSIAIDSADLPVDPAYIDSVLTLTGGTLHGISHWFNFCVVLLADSATIHVLDGKPYISSTKLTAYYSGTLHKPGSRNESQAIAQKKTSGDATYYGNTWQQTALVHGDLLHNAGYTGNGKLIAVLDAGFIDADTHTGFSSMWSDGRMVDKYNFTLKTDFIFGYDTHGTRAMSTIAGYVPGTYVGTAPMASFALYVTEDGNSEQPIELVNMLFASERADSIGADIITTSLGYNTFNNPADNFTFATDFDGKTTIAAQAANMATKKGILFVASAGNEGGGGWNMVLTPGDADSALTIGSVDVAGVVAPNSGYGPNAAGQIKPDVCGMGQAAAVFYGSGYGTQSGTSFATPQIAGWAACLWQAYPAATPSLLRQAIIKCASSYTSPGSHIGYGVPDFNCAKQMFLSVANTTPPFAPARWVAASPNPFGKEITLIVAPDTEDAVEFSLTDIAGKTVTTASGKFYKGYNAPFSIALPVLPAGIYILKAVSSTQQQVLKLVKE